MRPDWRGDQFPFASCGSHSHHELGSLLQGACSIICHCPTQGTAYWTCNYNYKREGSKPPGSISSTQQHLAAALTHFGPR